MPEEALKKRKHYAPNARVRSVLRAIARANEPPKIVAGDRVRWNDLYEGRVQSVNGDSAVVVEPHNWAFGRAVTWRLNIDALTRVGP